MDSETPSTSTSMTNWPNRRLLEVSRQKKQKERLDLLRKTKAQYDDLSDTIRKNSIQTRNLKDQMVRLSSKILPANNPPTNFVKQMCEIRSKIENLEIQRKKVELDLEVLLGMRQGKHLRHIIRKRIKEIDVQCENPDLTSEEKTSLANELIRLIEEETKSLKEKEDNRLAVDSSNAASGAANSDASTQRVDWINDIVTEMEILEKEFGSNNCK